MSRATPIIIASAVFVGVLAALQVNRYIENRQRSADKTVDWQIGTKIIPASGSSETIAAPMDFREAAKKVIPSVVSVDQYVRRQNFFGEDLGLSESGTGSGVIISRNGVIVTNNHVVADPRDPSRVVDQVKVRLPNKQTYEAKVVGHDRRSDLAVLKISAENLEPIEIGDSSKLEVGQWVVAVGNPLGFDNTVSVGVVSSLGRSLGLENSVLLDGIQTDAAINPGNSGGALTDAAGQLVGINSAIASGNGGSVGIGFAIPVNTVRRVVDQIMKQGYATYGDLGAQPYRDTVSLQSQYYRDQLEQLTGATPPSYGLIVKSIEVDSAASKAGLQQYDVLLTINGQKLDDTMALTKLLTSKQAGDTVNIEYWSHGKTKKTSVKLDSVRGD